MRISAAWMYTFAIFVILCSLFEHSLAFAQARSEGSAGQTAIAIAGFDYVDTSGEPQDQSADHKRRMESFMSSLRSDVASGDVATGSAYTIVALDCGSEVCVSGQSSLEDLKKAARAAGAHILIVGGVHKMSTLVQWAKVTGLDLDMDKVVFDKLATFRGDSDEAWERAEAFLAREIKVSLQGTPAEEKIEALKKIAVFEFELEDFSGGAGIIPESTADAQYLADSTREASRLIGESGSYVLIDIGNANNEVLKEHSLRNCDGCEAKIALDLGADQSFLGIVTRITRTDYAVTFKLRDARTGALVAVEQSDLRIGANYSWSRGAASLIKNRLLSKQEAK